MRKENFQLADLLQNLSNALSDREGRNAIHENSDAYVDGVRKAIPEIEKALEKVKSYLNYKDRKPVPTILKRVIEHAYIEEIINSDYNFDQLEEGIRWIEANTDIDTKDMLNQFEHVKMVRRGK
ncbi:hypothetical protein ACERII_02080 [Evansella sp. AB-rgal1]|uniref:hypothetical protein n=1 Tax=Evansella sp. AB-rgal1 TaxID=3242696 RepID=UPI00359F126D